jgi:uracil-DNA glycosylase
VDRESVQLILKELRQLRREGVDSIELSDASLEILRSCSDGHKMPCVENHPLSLEKTEASRKTPVKRSLVSVSVHEETLGHQESTAKSQHENETSLTHPIPETPPVIKLPSGSKQTQWEWLRKRVLECPVCLQHVRPGKKIVFGSGNLDAELFFCGEAPGKDEEEQGEVFVGKAGQLLQKIIEAMGFARHEVYIGNIMNWRPEMPTIVGNRPPSTEEMAFCLPYLKAQLEIVHPKVIIALGATAVSGLLGHDPSRRMRDVCNQWFQFENVPLMVTFHPSYLLRNNTKAAKRNVWEAMLQVLEFIGRPISERQKNYFL